ncbi:hypothetical protein BDY24DRAFT_152376 [Mrakia frigida]|uniref:urease accessory protein UreF n=1 Tax=Mrakia frigida TaxID=29902 RepID=UPI003FCC20B4
MASTSSPQEDFLLLLLSDSNLPTGGFHFSAGLESTTKHGFLPKQTSPLAPSALEPFLVASLRAHARSTLAFVASAHSISSSFVSSPSSPSSPSSSSTLSDLVDLDELYESMTSNHVTRRGSKTQGTGMLTLWQRGMRSPAYLQLEGEAGEMEKRKEAIMDGLRAFTRDGTMVGHMPVCWGVLCGVLSLSLDRTLHLHLFLHARSILSSSVRLNQTGPYHSQSLLLHTAQPLIDKEVEFYHRRPGMGGVRVGGISRVQGEQDEEDEAEEEGREGGPAGTWPLGEILQGRHDVMHSRMFNT